MSKLLAALGVEAYRDMGYLARSCHAQLHLLRLGWSFMGDDETIST